MCLRDAHGSGRLVTADRAWLRHDVEIEVSAYGLRQGSDPRHLSDELLPSHAFPSNGQIY